MRAVSRIMLAVLILCIPVASFLVAENVICRMPDFYSYEFTKAQASQEIEGQNTDKELGEFFSEFMSGKTDEFRYVAYEVEWEQELFSTDESAFMVSIRSLLNGLTVVLAGALVLSAVSIFFLIQNGEKGKLRFGFLLSSGVYVLLWGVIASLVLSMNITGRFGEESALAVLLTADFVREWLLAGMIASAVIMVFWGSLIWRLSKPKRMFW